MLALDPMTDFAPSYAAYVQANCPSWQIWRWEIVNELWNSNGFFFQTYYGWQKASVHWGTNNDQDNWAGYTGSMLGQAIYAAYGSPVSGSTKLIGGVPGAQYRLHVGVQVTFPDAIDPTTPGFFSSRFTAALFVAGSPVRSGFTNSVASFWMTHINTTSYYNPAMDGRLSCDQRC